MCGNSSVFINRQLDGIINFETYAAVAEKISTFFASVNSESANEKTEVKTITKPIRTSILFTKYRTKMAIVGSSEESIAPTELLMVAIRVSLYRRNPGVDACCHVVSFCDAMVEGPGADIHSVDDPKYRGRYPGTPHQAVR